MPAPGQLKPPMLPIRELHEQVMERIDGWSAPVGVFIVGGRLKCMRTTAPTFNHYADLLRGGFVGVYNRAADSRVVWDDLKMFYGGQA